MSGEDRDSISKNNKVKPGDPSEKPGHDLKTTNQNLNHKEQNEVKLEEENTAPEDGKTKIKSADDNVTPLNPDTEETGADETPADPMDLLREENKELQDKILRLAAEMENLRRRTEREKQDMAKFAITNFARDILTIDDNLNRALSSVPEAAIEEDPALKALVEGVDMTGRELVNVFERYGITRVDPKGEIFDPNCHQAMFEAPNPEVPHGTIIEVVATGYMIEGRVLRPAMVGLAKGGEKPQKPSDEAAAAKPDKTAEPGENLDKTT